MNYSPRSLVACYRAARAGHSIETGAWPNSVLTPEEYRAWFRDCLERKINAKDPRQPTGRKSQEEYQTELRRLRCYIGNRIIIHWIAPVLGARVRLALSHRMREF